MKKIFSLIIFAAFLASCDIESPYIKDGCPIQFEIVNMLGTQGTIVATPEDDRAFYYFSVMLQKDFQEWEGKDEHFMTIQLDSLYRDYLDWRSPLLYEKEDYITDFRSHAFSYGKAERYYASLKPLTDYVIYGFCINPDDIQRPIGKLYTLKFRTTDVNTSVSPMVIDFDINMPEHDINFQGLEASMIISARPSIHGKPTKEPYLFSYITEKDLNLYYGGKIINFVSEKATEIQSYIETSPEYAYQMLYHDISTIGVWNSEIEEGDWIYVVGAAYRISWMKALYTYRFQFKRGTTIPYTHDSKIDWTND